MPGQDWTYGSSPSWALACRPWCPAHPTTPRIVTICPLSCSMRFNASQTERIAIGWVAERSGAGWSAHVTKTHDVASNITRGTAVIDCKYIALCRWRINNYSGLLPSAVRLRLGLRTTREQYISLESFGAEALGSETRRPPGRFCRALRTNLPPMYSGIQFVPTRASTLSHSLRRPARIAVRESEKSAVE